MILKQPKTEEQPGHGPKLYPGLENVANFQED